MSFGKESTPDTPDYKGQAIASSNLSRYGESGPTGQVRWNIAPGADRNNPMPGDYTRETVLSPEQPALYDQQTAGQLGAGDLAFGQIDQLAGGQDKLQDALYRRATKYYDSNFARDEERLRTQLVGQGFAPASEGFAGSMENFRRSKNDAYADATDRAITGAESAQSSGVARLQQLLAMSGARMPQSANTGSSPDLVKAAADQYRGDVDAVNARNRRTEQDVRGLGGFLFGL